MTVALADTAATSRVREDVVKLLKATGHFEWLDDESQMDTVTGLSGSGPAYVFYLVECLARAGVDLGLNPEVAQRLARSTIDGAGELLRKSVQSPDKLRRQVTSPEGATEAGLRILMDGRLQELTNATVQAAAARSRTLAD